MSSHVPFSPLCLIAFNPTYMSVHFILRSDAYYWDSLYGSLLIAVEEVSDFRILYRA